MATLRLQALEEQVAQGLITESELRPARLELRRMELARRLAELRIQRIRGGGGEEEER